MRVASAWVIGCLAFACKTAEKSPPPAATAPPPAGSSAPTAAAPAAQAAPAPSAGVQQKVAADAPASFDAGQKDAINGVIGLGCESKSLDGWVELYCHKKNGTGGHPVRAVIHDPVAELLAAPSVSAEGAAAAVDGGEGDDGGAEPGEQIEPTERGELRLVLPFHEGTKRSVALEWTDTRYTLELDGATSKLIWAGAAVAHRKACQALLDENHARADAAAKRTDADKLSADEARHLPKLGVCQPGGLGSWALSLGSVTGQGDGAARTLTLALDVVRVDLMGKRLSAPLGTFVTAPGGLALAPLQAYDFDDDGNDELIVSYELNAIAPGTKPVAPSPIWSFSATGISAYAKAPAVSGGVGVEHLDSDMRPDLGTYGPFVAWFGADCGLKTCPPRLSGPRLFFHSLPDGSFSDTDAAAHAAVERTCPNKREPFLGPSGANVTAVAKNLACARARGVPVTTLRTELGAKHADLCGTAATCPLATTLEAWLDAPAPAFK
jgi:hypothetical protein